MFDLFTKVTPAQATSLGPVTLAFVGDAVYSLYIRHKVVVSSDKRPADLQKISSSYVSAHGQSLLLADIESRFTEEESAIYRRGRNAKKGTKSKNASVADYNRSTGFEAVLGYLYLIGAYDRINELLKEETE